MRQEQVARGCCHRASALGRAGPSANASALHRGAWLRPHRALSDNILWFYPPRTGVLEASQRHTKPRGGWVSRLVLPPASSTVRSSHDLL